MCPLFLEVEEMQGPVQASLCYVICLQTLEVFAHIRKMEPKKSESFNPVRRS